MGPNFYSLKMQLSPPAVSAIACLSLDCSKTQLYSVTSPGTMTVPELLCCCLSHFFWFDPALFIAVTGSSFCLTSERRCDRFGDGAAANAEMLWFVWDPCECMWRKERLFDLSSELCRITSECLCIHHFCFPLVSYSPLRLFGSTFPPVFSSLSLAPCVFTPPRLSPSVHLPLCHNPFCCFLFQLFRDIR